MNDFVPPAFWIPRSVDEELANAGTLFNVAAKAASLGYEVLRKHVKGREADTDYKKVGYLLFAKGFKTFTSIQNLSRSGCGSDALALCASLFENHVDLLYVGKDPVHRSRIFLQYESVEKYHQAKKILNHPDLDAKQRVYFQDQVKKLDPLVSGLLSQYVNASLGWSQKTLKARAGEVNLGLAYDLLYWIFCTQKHTQPGGATGFVIATRTGFDVVSGPSVRGVGLAVFHSTQSFLLLCSAFEQIYSLDFQAARAQIFSELLSSFNTLESEHPGICE